jgi:chaperonin GroEL
MTRKIIKFDHDAQEEIKTGIDILTRAVRTTMGPRGKTVIIERPGGHPLVTKDGVTVAKHINLTNRFQNLGVQVIKEAAQQSAEEAGDGTTTATVLAHAIFERGMQMISAGKDSVVLRKSIEIATKKVIKELQNSATSIKSNKELKQIALISCNGEEEIAELITEAIIKAGIDGSIIVENAKGYRSELVLVEGIKLDRGYLSPYFITNQDRMVCEFNKCFILLVNKKIDSIKDVMKPLEYALETDKQILLVADDIDDEALQALVMNKTKGNLKICIIKSPGFGNSRYDMMQDLSAITGGKLFGHSDSLSEFKEEDFGKVKKVIIGRSTCLFLANNDREELIKERVSAIRYRLENESFEENDIIAMKYRMQQLSGGIAILRVGASTEAEMIERRDRVDDSLSATRAAIQEGILPGGGISLAAASLKVEPEDGEETAGYDVIKYACFAPIKQIVRNTGKSADLVIEKINESGKNNYGYDARLEVFGDMKKLGVIDPLKVVRCALQNASSAATLLLTSECAMIEED